MDRFIRLCTSWSRRDGFDRNGKPPRTTAARSSIRSLGWGADVSLVRRRPGTGCRRRSRWWWLQGRRDARYAVARAWVPPHAMLPPKEERIHGHRHRARAHRERRPRRLEQDTQRRIQHAGSERDRDQVVDRGPEQILFDLAVHTTGKNESGGGGGPGGPHVKDFRPPASHPRSPPRPQAPPGPRPPPPPRFPPPP